MKINYLYRLRLHFLHSQDQQGWTRFDTLGLIIILLIFPFLCGNPFTYYQQINRSKQLEGKNNITNITRTQQAYFSEHNNFAKSIKEADTSIKTETENYQYSISTNNTTTYSYGISKKDTLKSYISGVFIMPKAKDSAIKTIGIICEAQKAGTMKPREPTLKNNLPVCSQDTSEIAKYL